MSKKIALIGFGAAAAGAAVVAFYMNGEPTPKTPQSPPSPVTAINPDLAIDVLKHFPGVTSNPSQVLKNLPPEIFQDVARRQQFEKLVMGCAAASGAFNLPESKTPVTNAASPQAQAAAEKLINCISTPTP